MDAILTPSSETVAGRRLQAAYTWHAQLVCMYTPQRIIYYGIIQARPGQAMPCSQTTKIPCLIVQLSEAYWYRLKDTRGI